MSKKAMYSCVHCGRDERWWPLMCVECGKEHWYRRFNVEQTNGDEGVKYTIYGWWLDDQMPDHPQGCVLAACSAGSGMTGDEILTKAVVLHPKYGNRFVGEEWVVYDYSVDEVLDLAHDAGDKGSYGVKAFQTAVAYFKSAAGSRKGLPKLRVIAVNVGTGNTYVVHEEW